VRHPTGRGRAAGIAAMAGALALLDVILDGLEAEQASCAR
jgi:hypothetical protein